MVRNVVLLASPGFILEHMSETRLLQGEMSGTWNPGSSRWRLAWPALLLALLTSGAPAPPLRQDEHSDNVDDGGDNTLFQGNNGFIMDYDGGDRLGSLAGAPPTTPAGGDRDRGSRPLPHPVASRHLGLVTLIASQPSNTYLQEAIQPAGIMQSETDESDKGIDILSTGPSHHTPLRGHLKVTNWAGHPRVPRSPTKHQSPTRPANCSVSPSCSARHHLPQEGDR